MKKVNEIFKKFVASKKNEQMFVTCTAKVNNKSIRREIYDGVEHIVVSSYTLPENIVMNGGLYPTDERNASYESINDTLAPVEHPTDSDGRFISASSPSAIANYHVGAFNRNARIDGKRIYVDKYINVLEAKKSEKGKRLLERIANIENGLNDEPIHTSTGIFLEVEEVDGIKVNEMGQEYTWIARNMVFDHDAILLDSEGAATPAQGVGIAVNQNGDSIDAHTYVIENEEELSSTPSETELSHEEIRELLYKSLKDGPFEQGSIHRVYSSLFIFESDGELYSAPYTIVQGKAKIVGIPETVHREETFNPKTNSEEDEMREVIVNALKEAGIEIDNLDDATLLAKYIDVQLNSKNTESEEMIANAIKPLADQLEALTAKLNEQSNDELNKLADVVGNSEKYPGLDVESAKKLGIETLKKMSVNLQSAHGLPILFNREDNDEFSIDTEMPN